MSKKEQKHFKDMCNEERMADLKERVNQFQSLSLPGQPMGMHMGTSYLVNDLWREVQRYYTMLAEEQPE